ncbi:hypothetical protein HRI_002494500 [Hibiscus trionum]|uniref:BHLH domain-containing protein n=1 Tax=Hibiscus trionum TaxID=183268 RepID=A0A9W7I3J7_HIBTR|nr:hypothetical protein HRI_002494500 [Hibiscus trionum]
MSEEGGHDSFLQWENQPWTAALSNSDNNNNNNNKSSGGTGSEDKSAGKTNDQQQPLQDSTNTKRVAESDHDNHIWIERERRKKMRDMFSTLHDLLPQLPTKADKSTIVDEAVNYIKTLEKTLQKLQKQKLERLQGCIGLGYHHETPTVAAQNHQEAVDSSSRESFMADPPSSKNNSINKSPDSLSVSQSPLQFQTWRSPNVVLNICGREAQISVCSPKKPGLFTGVCCILEKHKMEVTSAHVSSESNRCMFMIQAHVASTGASKHQQAEGSEVEGIFKQAAAEIMCWVTS